MTTLIAYMILQVSIITGGTTATKGKSTPSTNAAKCITNNGGWVDKD